MTHQDVRRPKTLMRSFKHSGDAGDIIYSLATVRLVGGGDFYLSKSASTRVLMNQIAIENIAPLLRSQPYIRKVEPYCGGSVAYDFDLFRALLNEREPLAVLHLRRFGLPDSAIREPWLFLDQERIKVTASPKVIISRTARYQNMHFPWTRIVEKYKGKCCFVGSRDEWEAFKSDFGQIDYLVTPTLLELAYAIAASQLFIGNQSTPYAIAEGLKKDSIQETCLWCPNCIFRRANAQFVPGERVELPNL